MEANQNHWTYSSMIIRGLDSFQIDMVLNINKVNYLDLKDLFILHKIYDGNQNYQEIMVEEKHLLQFPGSFGLC